MKIHCSICVPSRSCRTKIKKLPPIEKFPGLKKKFPGLKKLPGLKKQPGKKPVFPVPGLPGLTKFHPDWQLWYGYYYGQYPWAGYWGSPWLLRWDSYWYRRWQRRYPVLLVFGTTWWGLNRMGYQFGYYDYYNPYAANVIVLGDGVTVDYSDPLVEPTTAADEESPLFARARATFLAGRYARALTEINAALKQSPQDAVMHEFRALVLFALGRYTEAAAPLHAILAAGPGWDWKTLRSLYPDKATYTSQFRALEKHVTNNPKDAPAHFVLGYHYTALGHVSYAIPEFRQAVALKPRDAVARQMLTMLTKGTSEDDPNEADKEPPLPGVAAIPADKLDGSWIARRGKETFEMTITRDGRFTWAHTNAGGSKTVLKGDYAVKDGALALKPETGGVLLANVSFTGENAMTFRMVNEDDKDPGLKFTK